MGRGIFRAFGGLDFSTIRSMENWSQWKISVSCANQLLFTANHVGIIPFMKIQRWYRTLERVFHRWTNVGNFILMRNTGREFSSSQREEERWNLWIKVGRKFFVKAVLPYSWRKNFESRNFEIVEFPKELLEFNKKTRLEIPEINLSIAFSTLF